MYAQIYANSQNMSIIKMQKLLQNGFNIEGAIAQDLLHGVPKFQTPLSLNFYPLKFQS